MERRALPKRFYKRVGHEPMHGGHAVTLDGKPIKTPAKKVMIAPTQQLAEAIVAEWEAQDESIDPEVMPLTRLLNITLDRVEHDRAALLVEVNAYAETDLLYYRAPAEPLPSGEGGAPRSGEGAGIAVASLHHALTPRDARPSPVGRGLAERQAATFTPILEWFALQHNLEFAVTDGILPIAQPPASLQKIAALFAAANAAELGALAMLVPMLGSALLAIAVWQGRVSVETALSAARLDENFQAEKWGMDVDTQKNWDAKCRDIRAAALFMALVR